MHVHPASARPQERVLEHLRRHPGASTPDVAAAFGVDPSTADYHLKRLRRSGRAVAETVGRASCWFPAGYCPVLRKSIPLMAKEDAQRVAMALDDAPRPATRVAQATGLRLGSVRWIASALEEAGIVERSRLGLLTLAPGAGTCVARAAQRSRCDEWGRCPVSQAWAKRQQGKPGPKGYSTRFNAVKL